MSRILKRPMFRKGGEVMEGIMTGIKPRENFAIKGMSNDMAEQLKSVQQRVNFIDQVAGVGSSPLSDPLTQFLLTAGPDLVAGKAAGGNKLQEIIGGIKPGLDRATAMQMQKDASRKKLTASLLSKMGTNDIAKIEANAKRISQITGNPYDQVLQDLMYKYMYADPKGPQELELRSDEANIKSLLQKKDARGNPELTRTEAERINVATKKAKQNDVLKNRLDPRLEYIPKKAGITASKETINGQERTVYKPKVGSIVDFEDDFIYFDTRLNKFLIYKEDLNLFIPVNSE
jgi:hypothetical protein